MTRPYLTSDPAACTHGYRMHECPTCTKFIIPRTRLLTYCDVCTVRSYLYVLGTVEICERCLPISSLVTGPPYKVWDLTSLDQLKAEYAWWDEWCYGV